MSTTSAGTAAVTEGTTTVGVATFSGNATIVPLTGVSNQRYVTASDDVVAALG